MFNSFNEFWWEEDMFNRKDPIDTVEISKSVLDEIRDINDPYAATTFIEQDIVDDRTLEELIHDDFIELEGRTPQQLVDNDFIELEDRTPQQLVHDDFIEIESDNNQDTDDENEVNELTLAQIQWDPKNTAVSADTKPRIKLSTDFNRKLKAANKIKKIQKKIIGTRRVKSTWKDWLKNAGYLDTKDQDGINYILVLPKDVRENDIPYDAEHFICTEIESTDFKKSNLASKMTSSKNKKI